MIAVGAKSPHSSGVSLPPAPKLVTDIERLVVSPMSQSCVSCYP